MSKSPPVTRLAPDVTGVLILRNARAGRGHLAQRFDSLVASLQQRGYTVEVLTDREVLFDRSRQLRDAGVLRTVLAAGGDGTVETVVNRIPADVPLSLLPLGTENLLAKYLGISLNPEVIAETVAAGRVVQLDLGQFRRANDPPRRFVLMMGCGFDAEVVHRLHRDRKGNINHLSYAKPIVESIRSYQYPPLTVTFRETPTSSPHRVITAHFAFIFNMPCYAAGLPICPEANPFDGRLDVTTFAGGSFWQGLMHVSAVILGQHRNLAGVESNTAACLTVEAEQDVPFQADGDPGGNLPVEIQVLPSRLSVIVPPHWLNQIMENSEAH